MFSTTRNEPQVLMTASRVQWRLAVEDDAYVKLEMPELNWVWSPQGVINMHYPEMWGVVEFKDLGLAAASERVEPDRIDRAGWLGWPPSLDAGADTFSASIRVTGRGNLSIDQTGRLWWTD